MSSETSSATLIERYLRTRQVRYFRGQHDGQFFFLVTAEGDRLHVHLEFSRVGPDTFTIHVTPSYFFAAEHRAALVELANTWNHDDRPAKVVLCQSSDPHRIGVVAENSCSMDDVSQFEDFAEYVDRTIDAAIDLFSDIALRVAPAARTVPALVRHAG
jgi:hypothetical protein